MKKHLKKLVSIGLVTLLSAGLLAGCDGGSSAGGEGNQAGGSKDVTITFGSHQSGLPTTGVVQELAKEFEKETGIKVDFQISPDAQWRDLVKVKMDSGEAPDIMCVDTPIGLTSSLHMDKYSVPLTDQEWVSRMDPNVLPAVSKGDDVYGITFAGKKMYFYIYSKPVFEKLNLTEPTNYEEFKAVCQKIKDSGVIPVYECTVNGWHQVLPLFETGGLYLKNHPGLYEQLNKNETTFAQLPELLTIIGQLKECADLGYYGNDYLSNSHENSKEAVASGQYAMTIAEIGWKGEVKADFPDAPELGQFVMPWGDNQTIGVNPASNAYFISKDSKHIEECKQFFAFLARPENLKKRLEGQPNLSDLSWPEIPGRYTAEEQAYIDSHDKATVVQVAVNYVDSQWMDIGKDLEGMYTNVLTPKEIVEIIDNRRAEQAELQKDPAWAK